MELRLADLSKENSQYLRKDIDGGILTEKYQIDRYKLEQYSNVIDNLMLGNYNELGIYEIQPEIKEELINCLKVVESSYENILFVKSIASANVFSNLEFAVKVVDSEQNGYKMAVLELLEPIYKAKGYIENTQATVLKKIVLPNNEIFKSEVFKAFNITLKKTGDEKVENNEDELKNIINRKIQLLYIKQKTFEMEHYEVCYNNVKEELQKTEEGKKVLVEAKKDEEVAEKYLKVEPTDFKAKTEILIKNVENIIKTPSVSILNNLIDLYKKNAQKAKILTLTVAKPVKTTIKQKKKRALNNLIEDALVK